jgi:hypothetical protein
MPSSIFLSQTSVMGLVMLVWWMFKAFSNLPCQRDRDDQDGAGHRCLLNAEQDNSDRFLEIGEFMNEDQVAVTVVGVIGYCSQRTI